MHGLAVDLKEGFPFAQNLFLENSGEPLIMFLTDFTSLSVLLLDSFSANIDDVLQIKSSADMFFFGDFNVLHEDSLTYSGVTGRPGELCHIPNDPS